MVNCFIIAGPETINVLSAYVKSFSVELAGTAVTLKEGIAGVLLSKPDIVYIDMDCVKADPIEFNLLKQSSFFIILSDTIHSAYDAFKFRAFDYLLKPVGYLEFIEGVERFKSMSIHFSRKIPDRGLLSDFFFIKIEDKGSKEIMIKYADLLFVEALQNYVILTLEGGSSYISYSTMKEMEINLPGHLFIRVHKSFIINYSKITSIEGNWVNLSNNTYKIQIGSTYKKMLFEKKDQRMISGHKRKSAHF